MNTMENSSTGITSFLEVKQNIIDLGLITEELMNKQRHCQDCGEKVMILYAYFQSTPDRILVCNLAYCSY